MFKICQDNNITETIIEEEVETTDSWASMPITVENRSTWEGEVSGHGPNFEEWGTDNFFEVGVAEEEFCKAVRQLLPPFRQHDLHLLKLINQVLKQTLEEYKPNPWISETRSLQTSCHRHPASIITITPCVICALKLEECQNLSFWTYLASVKEYDYTLFSKQLACTTLSQEISMLEEQYRILTWSGVTRAGSLEFMTFCVLTQIQISIILTSQANQDMACMLQELFNVLGTLNEHNLWSALDSLETNSTKLSLISLGVLHKSPIDADENSPRFFQDQQKNAINACALIKRNCNSLRKYMQPHARNEFLSGRESNIWSRRSRIGRATQCQMPSLETGLRPPPSETPSTERTISPTMRESPRHPQERQQQQRPEHPQIPHREIQHQLLMTVVTLSATLHTLIASRRTWLGSILVIVLVILLCKVGVARAYPVETINVGGVTSYWSYSELCFRGVTLDIVYVSTPTEVDILQQDTHVDKCYALKKQGDYCAESHNNSQCVEAPLWRVNSYPRPIANVMVAKRKITDWFLIAFGVMTAISMIGYLVLAINFITMPLQIFSNLMYRFTFTNATDNETRVNMADQQLRTAGRRIRRVSVFLMSAMFLVSISLFIGAAYASEDANDVNIVLDHIYKMAPCGTLDLEPAYKRLEKRRQQQLDAYCLDYNQQQVQAEPIAERKSVRYTNMATELAKGCASHAYAAAIKEVAERPFSEETWRELVTLHCIVPHEKGPTFLDNVKLHVESVNEFKRYWYGLIAFEPPCDDVEKYQHYCFQNLTRVECKPDQRPVQCGVVVHRLPENVRHGRVMAEEDYEEPSPKPEPNPGPPGPHYDKKDKYVCEGDYSHTDFSKEERQELSDYGIAQACSPAFGRNKPEGYSNNLKAIAQGILGEKFGHDTLEMIQFFESQLYSMNFKFVKEKHLWGWVSLITNETIQSESGNTKFLTLNLPTEMNCDAINNSTQLFGVLLNYCQYYTPNTRRNEIRFEKDSKDRSFYEGGITYFVENCTENCVDASWTVLNVPIFGYVVCGGNICGRKGILAPSLGRFTMKSKGGLRTQVPYYVDEFQQKHVINPKKGVVIVNDGKVKVIEIYTTVGQECSDNHVLCAFKRSLAVNYLQVILPIIVVFFPIILWHLYYLILTFCVPCTTGYTAYADQNFPEKNFFTKWRLRIMARLRDYFPVLYPFFFELLTITSILALPCTLIVTLVRKILYRGQRRKLIWVLWPLVNIIPNTYSHGIEPGIKYDRDIYDINNWYWEEEKPNRTKRDVVGPTLGFIQNLKHGIDFHNQNNDLVYLTEHQKFTYQDLGKNLIEDFKNYNFQWQTESCRIVTGRKNCDVTWVNEGSFKLVKGQRINLYMTETLSNNTVFPKYTIVYDSVSVPCSSQTDWYYAPTEIRTANALSACYNGGCPWKNGPGSLRGNNGRIGPARVDLRANDPLRWNKCDSAFGCIFRNFGLQCPSYVYAAPYTAYAEVYKGGDVELCGLAWHERVALYGKGLLPMPGGPSWGFKALRLGKCTPTLTVVVEDHEKGTRVSRELNGLSGTLKVNDVELSWDITYRQYFGAGRVLGYVFPAIAGDVKLTHTVYEVPSWKDSTNVFVYRCKNSFPIEGFEKNCQYFEDSDRLSSIKDPSVRTFLDIIDSQLSKLDSNDEVFYSVQTTQIEQESLKIDETLVNEDLKWIHKPPCKDNYLVGKVQSVIAEQGVHDGFVKMKFVTKKNLYAMELTEEEQQEKVDLINFETTRCEGQADIMGGMVICGHFTPVGIPITTSVEHCDLLECRTTTIKVFVTNSSEFCTSGVAPSINSRLSMVVYYQQVEKKFTVTGCNITTPRAVQVVDKEAVGHDNRPAPSTTDFSGWLSGITSFAKDLWRGASGFFNFIFGGGLKTVLVWVLCVVGVYIGYYLLKGKHRKTSLNPDAAEFIPTTVHQRKKKN